jgi:Flp pilus assembly protein TadB
LVFDWHRKLIIFVLTNCLLVIKINVVLVPIDIFIVLGVVIGQIILILRWQMRDRSGTTAGKFPCLPEILDEVTDSLSF